MSIQLSPVRLPTPEKAALQLGYMRLSDAAPLVIAKELGIFRHHRLDVTLSREVSWANIRDKLTAGALDGAQMLAPMPAMSTFGVGGLRTPMLTGLVLSLNGNAITLSSQLCDEMVELGGKLPARDPKATAARLKKVITRHETSGMITLAVVHMFSTHMIQLRMWLKSGGIDPDRDVRIIVLSPEQMVDNLTRGIIDGCCVGEPWNSVAVQNGVGSIVALGYDVWNNCPEKVFAVTQDWHNRNNISHLTLRVCLIEACRWLADPDNRPEAAEILAKARWLDLPERYIRPSLLGELTFQKGGEQIVHPDAHVFGRYQAGFPFRSIATRLTRYGAEQFGGRMRDDQIADVVQTTWRTDLYREAARVLKLQVPTRDSLPEQIQDTSWSLETEILMGANRRIDQ